MLHLSRRLVPLVLLALLFAGCDRAAEFIPGEANPSATESATPPPVLTEPILPPSTLNPGTDAGSSSLAEAIPDDQLAASVALIETLGPPAGLRTGTGVVVDTNLGLVLTSYQLVQRSDASGVRAYDTLTVTVAEEGGSPVHYQADIVTADPLLDLAVLRVARSEDGEPLEAGAFHAPSVSFGEPARIARGVEIRALGFEAPQSSGAVAQLLVTHGSVLGFRGSADVMGRAWVKTDIRLPGAGAGAPVFDQQGGLVGIALPVRYAPNVEVGQVRAAELALPLVEEARSAGPAATYTGPLWKQRPGPDSADGVAVSEIDFAENALDSAEGGDLFDYAAALPVGQQRLHYEFAVQGVQPGSIVEERWYLNGVLQDGISSSLAWANGSFAILSDRILAATERGLQPGVWRLEVWVDDVLRSAGGVVIGTDPSGTTPQATTFRFGTSAQPDDRPRGTPSGQADRLLASFDYSGTGGARHVRWIVFKDGAPVYESPSLPWRGGNAGTWWVGYAGDAPIGPGFWEVEVYFDDRRAGVEGIQLF